MRFNEQDVQEQAIPLHVGDEVIGADGSIRRVTGFTFVEVEDEGCQTCGECIDGTEPVEVAAAHARHAEDAADFDRLMKPIDSVRDYLGCAAFQCERIDHSFDEDPHGAGTIFTTI